jgi:UDP-glucose 4-epimerase
VKKALVTGGAGFLGFHLVRNLHDHGYHVDLVDNFSRGHRDDLVTGLLGSPAARMFDRDLLVENQVEDLDDDYDLVFHFAAIVGVDRVLIDPYEVLRANALMTINALALAMRQGNLKRFVFASTSEVYAGTLQHFTLPIPTEEATPLALLDLDHPRTSYMLSKIYGETLCHHARIPATILRPHNVYGPRMGLSHVIPELLERAHRAEEGDSLHVFSVDHRRAFCYVDDAVEMIRRAAESPRCDGQTLNIGTESPEISIGELARTIVRTIGRDLEIVPEPATPGSPSRRCPDMSKTVELTGCRALVGLEEGVERTYRWYREQVFDGARYGYAR